MQNLETVDVEQYFLGNGGFLLAPTPPGVIFSHEQLSEEQREMGRNTLNFCKNKARPLDKEQEEKARDTDGVLVTVKLFKEAGKLGILGVGVPEQYGGMGMDFTTTMYMIESLSVYYGGFTATSVSHMGIGIMPILLFGSDEQKKRYLPKFAAGEWLGCYALTEPGSGSDALSGKTSAKLEGEYYLLNGSKQFITNGGWADVAVVFARIDDQYSALIVELAQQGVSRGSEEKKMGLRGSSTASITFENVKVAKENLLGQIGDAAKIALNVLNVGRLELALGALGGAKAMMDRVIAYGKERRQFGQPIIEFDMQMARLADMAVKTFAVDSILYRTIGAIERKIKQIAPGENHYEQLVAILRFYALEASICKVVASENFFEVARDGIKIHGGYGYMEEYGVERALRDSVANIIVEGTNDVNRLVIFDFLVRNIYRDGIPYQSFMEKLAESLRTKQFQYSCEDSILREEKRRLYAAKCAVAFLLQRTLLRYGQNIATNQQLIELLANLLIALYTTDSVLGRVHYLVEKHNGKQSEIEQVLARLAVAENLGYIRTVARQILPDLADEQQLGEVRRDLEWFLELTESAENIFLLKRKIAKALLKKGCYYF
jgi:alkylation response protein AidB-like acyl-CoA dehydrogenase